MTCSGWYALPDVDLSLGSLLVLAFAGAVVWPLNPEAAVVLHVSAGGLHPMAVAAVAAVGQLGAHLLLWSGGTWLRRSWRWFDRQCARTQARFGPRLARGTIPVVMSAGVFGFPPAWAAATLGPGLGLSPQLVLPLLFLGRIVRFGVLGLVAAGLLGKPNPEIVSSLVAVECLEYVSFDRACSALSLWCRSLACVPRPPWSSTARSRWPLRPRRRPFAPGFGGRAIARSAGSIPRFLSFAVDTAQVVGGEFWAPPGQGRGLLDTGPVRAYDFSRPRLRQLAAAPRARLSAGRGDGRRSHHLPPA